MLTTLMRGKISLIFFKYRRLDIPLLRLLKKLVSGTEKNTQESHLSTSAILSNPLQTCPTRISLGKRNIKPDGNLELHKEKKGARNVK